MAGLAEKVRELRTREDLVAFLHLAADDVTANPQDWENDNLPAFLEAWAAWLNDCPGWFAWKGEDVPEVPSWKLVGDMVMAARIYE